MTKLTLFRGGSTSRDLIPTEAAASTWGAGDAMRGMAVSAALARGALLHLRGIGTDWIPASWSVAFARPALLQECRVSARTVRVGRRLLLVDVAMEQGPDKVVAWGRGAFVRQSDAASGRVWQPEAALEPAPPAALFPDASRLYFSEGSGWSSDPDAHQNATRKAVWQRPFAVVESEPTHPFSFIAGVADISSVSTQWGDRGIQHINIDLSLHLARMPHETPDGIGVVALHRASHGGQAIGTAELYDSAGTIGTAAVTAIQNEAQMTPDQLRVAAPRTTGTADGAIE